jgi:hypothetical protein
MGSISPQSFQKIGGAWFFLNNERKVVQLGGAEFKVVSSDIDNELQGVGYIEDAVADVLNINGRSLYVLSFLREDKTFVYDYKLECWYRWGNWNSARASYKRWLGNCFTYASGWGLGIAGHKDDGKLYIVDETYNTDAGTIIRAAVRTGYFDHGSMVKKRSARVRFRAKKGYGTAASTVMFRFRDNDGQNWEERQISFPLADYDIFAIQNQLGMYRARQYEVVMSDNAPFLAGQFEEEFFPMMR